MPIETTTKLLPQTTTTATAMSTTSMMATIATIRTASTTTARLSICDDHGVATMLPATTSKTMTRPTLAHTSNATVSLASSTRPTAWSINVRKLLALITIAVIICPGLINGNCLLLLILLYRIQFIFIFTTFFAVVVVGRGVGEDLILFL